MEYSDQTLYIHDLATAEGVNYVIEGSQFTDCVIKGPAVVTLLRTSGDGGGVDVPAYDSATVVIVGEEGRSVVPVGVVLIRDCSFNGCSFEGVSFFGSPHEMEALRTSLMSNVPSSQ